MMVRKVLRLLSWAVLVALMAHQAYAVDINQQKANAAWKQTDLCAQEAFKKFPDYTAESNKKRAAAREACLRNHRLPTPAGAEPAPAPGDG